MSKDVNFQGRKVLFIGPRFFGYEQEIARRLRELGASVEYFDDRPSASASMKVAIRLFPRVVEGAVRRYFESMLAGVDADYDFVLIIKLECMPRDILVRFREKLSSARFIYYSWDSVRNNPNFEGAADLFDALFTFDSEDSRRDTRLALRPLFFLNEYRNIAKPALDFDLCFVGTVHSDRFALIRKLRARMEAVGARLCLYLYIPHLLIYRVKRVALPAFWGSRRSDFSFTPLRKAEVMDLISRSRAVLDIQHPGQTGLTMRTIEMVGARKKLITTNVRVRDYDFYRPENIMVIDRADPVVDPVFLAGPYQELPPDLYEKYSLDGWIREVFSAPTSAQTTLREDEATL